MSAWMTRLMPLLLAAVLGSLVWLLDRAAEQPADVHAPAANLPDLKAEIARVQRYDAQGARVSVLTAVSAQHIPQDDTMLFEQPRLEQTKPGQPKIIVSGEQGKTIHRASEVWFYGKVEMSRAADAKNPDLLIHTRDMYVDTVAQIARSSALVTAEMGAHRARGVGFVADNKNETLELLSQVSMTYVPNKRTAGASSGVQP
ncbi:MAG: LPS export ABC transporter periplasmic protein LptC [Formivibrio sp.]|nr:LPS export ABC transporter periplasmic protein LptC [Formivibrio sp.]